MRIGFITDKIYPYYVGGYETRYWKLAKHLSRDYEVHVFTSCPEDRIINGIFFHRVAPYLRYVDDYGFRIMGKDILYSLLLLKDLFKKMDFIDCNATPFVYIPVAKLMSKISGAKLAVTVHEAFLGSLTDYFSESLSWKNILVRKFLKNSIPNRFIPWSLRLADDIIAVSKITGVALENGFNVSNVKIVPNGVDVSLIDNFDLTSKKGNVVSFLGRLSPEKNVEELLLAISQVKKNGDDVFCRIIGDGPEYGRLIKLVCEENIADNVRFHGFVDNPTKYKLLTSSDFFVLPSKREGFSIASMEAMGCGLPVIAAKPVHLESSGVFGHLQEGFNGLSYPLGDPYQLAERISELLNCSKTRGYLGSNAYSTAESFSWEKVVELYKQVLDG